MSVAETLHLHLRTRVELFKGTGIWDEVFVEKDVPASEIAILLCDLWDRHWCPGATGRVGEMAPVVNAVIKQARAKGVQIIHAPSDTLNFYADSPHRQRMQSIPRVSPPVPLDIAEGAFPIDDSDGGCDSPPETQVHAVNTSVWTRQHPAIEITGSDVLTDNGEEVYSLLRNSGITTLIVLGVHTNMCVLGRSFGIRQMTKWGIHCLLMRDLTDAMYNPAMPPHVDHFAGTELVIEHIEKYWCPTITSADFAGSPPFRFLHDTRPYTALRKKFVTV